MSYDWGRTMSEDTDKPYAWQAVGGTIWTSEDNRPLPQWRGLTDIEIHDCFQNRGSDKLKTRKLIAAAIEAVLKEKNT
jgi:hypothetical protein